MKNSPLPGILLAVLALSAFASLFLCYSYVTNAREMRQLQMQVSMINGRKTAVSALINDCVEYSSRNHAIDSVLESIGLHRSASNSAPSNPRPAGK